MKRLLCFLSIFMMFATGIQASSDTLELAEQLFKSGQLNEAIVQYESLSESYRFSGPYWYNLGTLYAQADDTGRSLRALYIAQDLMPRDADLRHNIALMESRVSGRLAPRETLFSLFDQATRFATPIEWLSLVLLILLTWSFLIYLRLSHRLRIPWVSLLSVGGGVVLFFLVVTSQAFRVSNHAEGVVISSKVALYAGPSTALSNLFYVHSGQRFKVLQHVQSWSKILCPNGAVGWISNADMSLLP